MVGLPYYDERTCPPSIVALEHSLASFVAQQLIESYDFLLPNLLVTSSIWHALHPFLSSSVPDSMMFPPHTFLDWEDFICMPCSFFLSCRRHAIQCRGIYIFLGHHIGPLRFPLSIIVL